jgi:UDP:flavonoid glycosyltransferase YjiC (YdhE family)
MKIVLATFGSRGDVQPMLALSLALIAKGHDVLLSAPPEKAAWAKQLGCPFHPLGSDVTAFIDGLENAHSLRSAICFVSFLRKELTAQFDLLPKIITGADLVIGSSLTFALSTLAEFKKIEYRYIAFAPQVLPSGYHPFPAFKHQKFPNWYNRITWRIARLLDRYNITRLINIHRKKLGLKLIPDAWRDVLGQHVIVASDSVISKVPADIVEPAVTQTGYMHLKQTDQLLPELDAFLEAGPPPVYAGFGSMPIRDQIRIVSVIVEAVRLSGQRAVISKFWDAPSEFSNAADIFFIKKYPHLNLFPKMAAVIHHGGAGTTATAAISGVPQIIVPHILDQYFWGHQIYRAKLGPRPIWRSELTSKKLATAILECLSNEDLWQKVRDASSIIKQQDSIEFTISEILGSLNEYDNIQKGGNHGNGKSADRMK